MGLTENEVGRNLAQSVTATRPMVPAKDFEISKRFYVELGFHPRPLTDQLVEMQLGVFSFIPYGFYVREWADNFVSHVTVSDVSLWRDHIVSLDLPPAMESRPKRRNLKAGLWSPA
jgi:hypothetical protein